MRVVQCPDVAVYEVFSKDRYVFVAGGITGTYNWQVDFIQKLDGTDGLILLNPRRDNFDVNNPSMSDQQIEWEYGHIDFSDAVSFWFPPETLCPITLYELGRALGEKRKVFVGTDPLYKRRYDVVKQISLIDPSIIVHDNLDDLTQEIKRWAKDGV